MRSANPVAGRRSLVSPPVRTHAFAVSFPLSGSPMESSPAAAMASASSSSRSRDPLLLGGFNLPAGWGSRKSMGFCRDIDASPEPKAAAAVEAENNGSRSPARRATEEAPRRQWSLRERTAWPWRDEDVRQSKKLDSTEGAGGGQMSRSFSVALTRQEIDADFIAITGRKPPRRPKKRTKSVQRQMETLCPGSSLIEVTRDRYKVNEKGGF